MKGSEAVVRMLQQLGVDVMFGLCGDTTLPLYEALHDFDHGIRHVLTRDERSASYMADAYSRLSGNVGVCEGPSGGGATYIIPGIAEANASSVPVVCLTSDIDTRDANRGTLTELDQRALFSPLTRSTSVPTSASELPRAIRNAFVSATAGPLGAAHVGLPFNVLRGEVDSDISIDRRWNAYPAYRSAPDSDSLKAAARLLAEARRPLILAGAGVLRSGAWDELTSLAHLLGAPVATSISGKGSIAETDPYALGVIGSNGALPYRDAFLRQADVIFSVGCRMGSVTTRKWTAPADGEKTIVQLDVEAARIGLNYRVAVGLAGDAKLGLATIIEEAGRRLGGAPGAKTDPHEIARSRQSYIEQVGEFSSDDLPIRPERFLAELFRVLPDKTVICADAGTPCPYLSAYWRIPKPGRWFATPRAHGALGYALPAVVGAYYACPEAGRVLGIMGDGSFGISAGELETIARLNCPVTLIVLNNAGYGWIKAGQKMLGGKYYSVDLSDTNHAAIAHAYGIPSVRVENPGDLHGALSDSIRAAGPFLVDIVVQPLHEARAPVSAWIA